MQEETLRVLGELTRALVHGDAPAIEALLASDVRTVTDGGAFHAARKPIVGRERVAHFYRRLAELGGGNARVSMRMLNGLPGLVMTLTDSKPGYPPHGIIHIDLDDDGKVRTIHSVLATGKLTAIRFD